MTTIFRNKPVVWQKDALARKRMAPHLAGGKFNGRHLIEQDTPISGGVYVSTSKRLIISVNGRSDKISGIYRELLEGAGRNIPLTSICACHFLCHVGMACGILKKDYLDFLQTFEGMLNVLHPQESEDIKIDLDMLIEMEIGDCRVFALLSAVLIERLIEDKFVIGKVSIDRNEVPGIGGHVWVRFEGGDGKIIIVDSTNDYVGSEESEMWPYKRP